MESRPQIMENSFSPHKRGFDFSNNTNATAFATADGTGFNFGSSAPVNKDTPPPGSAGSSNTNPFVFGAFGQETRCEYCELVKCMCVLPPHCTIRALHYGMYLMGRLH